MRNQPGRFDIQWIEQQSRGFSCPQEKLNSAFLQTIMHSYSREITRRFIERFGKDIAKKSSGLIPLLESWISQEEFCGFVTVWDLAFERLRSASDCSTPIGVCFSAAAAGLRLCEFDSHGEWTVQLDSTARLRFGRYLLPACDALNVCSDRDRVWVRTSFGDSCHEMSFHRDGERRWIDISGNADALTSIDGGLRPILILSPEAIDTPEFDHLRSDLSVASPEPLLRGARSAIKLIEAYASPYLLWANRVVTSIVPLRVIQHAVTSGSEFGLPGIICLQNRDSPEELAEGLVHEGAHEYMHILSRLGNLDDGSDTALYYSPVRRTKRPLRAILVAYHAFANVMLFYRLCRSDGFNASEYFEVSEKRLIPDLQQLEEVLRSAHALTTLGNSLWQPLASRLHGRSDAFDF